MENSWLSTRTQKFCAHCGEELAMIEPSTVLAERPVEVDLICPTCGHETTAELTMQQIFRSIYPHLMSLSPGTPENDNAWPQLGATRFSSDPPPSGMLH